MNKASMPVSPIAAFRTMGREGNRCRYEFGTAEQPVGEYLDMLKEMKGE